MPQSKNRIIRVSADDASIALIGETWRMRNLIYLLAMRDVFVHYKQTFLGIIWVLLRPAIVITIFVGLFGYVANFSEDSTIPMVALVAVGVMPWQFYSGALTLGSNSLVANLPLVTKAYIPRLIFPVAAIVAGLVDLAITLVILMVILLVLGTPLTWTALYFPLVILFGIFVMLGPILLSSAMIVIYRDLRVVMPFLVQAGTLMSPVGYTLLSIPEDYRMLYAINPMVGVLELGRWSLFGVEYSAFPMEAAAISAAWGLGLLIIGWTVFSRIERDMADII
ncbi:MAG: ABC transporter permease [Marinobacter nauticus]